MGGSARCGISVTSSQRSRVDRTKKRIVLIDGAQLTELMIDHGVGVADVETYVIKRIDTDYFAE